MKIYLLCLLALLINVHAEGEVNDLYTDNEFNFINNSPYPNLQKRKYKLFTNWYDCAERVTVLFYYRPQPDTGSLSRVASFKTDPLVAKSCQQFNGNSYGSVYDRGHLVPANHLDHDQIAIAESNYMTNILPQIAILNRGAWLLTEEIIECLRDDHILDVVGGMIMGNDASNDVFITSHGIRTPDWFWKIIHNKNTNEVIAWLMPNDNTTTKTNLDMFLTSVKDIEEKTGFKFPTIPSDKKHIKLDKSWAKPQGCDLS